MDQDDVLATHIQEIRRGSVVLACLSLLEHPHYGYALLDTLARGGFAVEANTLYPLLRRLEKQSLVTAEWNTDEPRPRKYYRLSESGRLVRAALAREWTGLNIDIENVLRGVD